MDFNYDEESVQDLVKWAETTEFPKELELSKCENIKDVPRYVKTNISDIKTLFPNVYCYGAINRLYRLKESLGYEV